MARLACKSDESWVSFWYLFIAGAVFQFWPIVARYSKNIVFDAILYDSIGILTWSIALMFWSGGRFTVAQWMGTFIAFVGLLLVQKG
ncbi:MAG: hypothetical protein ACOC5T_07445 [Elusimicrobiota bacterium]